MRNIGQLKIKNRCDLLHDQPDVINLISNEKLGLDNCSYKIAMYDKTNISLIKESNYLEESEAQLKKE